jgi:1-phosphofructokinase family hexose kinase
LIYCTLFNPAVDAVYQLEEIENGTSAFDVKSRIVPAGKGLNVAVTLKTLGENVCVAGIVHEYNQKQFSDYLDMIGIGSHLVVVPGATRINVTFTENKTGQTTHISSAQATVSPGLQDDLLDFFRSGLDSQDICVCSGSIPPGMSNDAYQKLIKICKEKGSAAMLDCSGKALKTGVRAKPQIIKPNLEELEGFFGEKIEGVHHIALKGKRLIDMGIDYVFISLGSDGMIALHDNDCLLCLPPHIKAINTVGCGDALLGGIAAGNIRKFSFSETCRMAVACGTAKAMHDEPAGITRDEIWRLMEDVKIKAV